MAERQVCTTEIANLASCTPRLRRSDCFFSHSVCVCVRQASIRRYV